MNPDLLAELIALSRLLRASTDPQAMAAIASTIGSLTSAASMSTPSSTTHVSANSNGFGPAGTVTPFGTVGVKDPGNLATPQTGPASLTRVVPMSDQDAYEGGDTTRASAKAAAWAAERLAKSAAAGLGPDGFIDVRLLQYPGPVKLSPVRALWNPSGNGIMQAAAVYRDFAFGDGSVSLADLRTALATAPNKANLDQLTGMAPEFRALTA